MHVRRRIVFVAEKSAWGASPTEVTGDEADWIYNCGNAACTAVRRVPIDDTVWSTPW